MVLIFRCAQGPVMWIVTRTDARDAAIAICQNDQTAVTMTATAGSSWVASLQAILQRTVQLRGTVQEVVVMPARIY